MKNLKIVLAKYYDANSYFFIDETPLPPRWRSMEYQNGHALSSKSLNKMPR